MIVTALTAALAATLTWWVSTAAILLLDGLPRRTYVLSMSAASGLLGVALYGVAHFANDSSTAGVYAGFGCGILVWAWLEMSFLMGYLTGPRRTACSAECGGWRHFLHAVQVILYHELAIIVLGFAVFALSWHGSNHIAAWTVTLLWALRASAKLNLFFGVRNLNAELLPDSLAYLGSYFRKRPMNLLFPFSVTAGSILVTLLVGKLFARGIGEAAITGYSLLATLAALGLLEHWMLVLPTRGSLAPCLRRSTA